ncbi:SDR family NAD(P)-dependent oxidoreductase, partial [Bordetella tumbae]
MLDVINSLADGYVAVPVIEACRRHDVFSLLANRSALSAEQLVAETGANSGHLRVALRLLVELGWLEQISADEYALAPAAHAVAQVPANTDELIDLKIPDVLRESTGAKLKNWLDVSIAGWNGAGRQLAGMLDGALLSPLLVEIHRLGGVPVLEGAARPDAVSTACLAVLHHYFEQRRWGSVQGTRFALNGAGRYLVESGGALGTVVSYRPMMCGLDAVLFGKVDDVFRRDEQGHELHVERQLNVTGSGSQHKIYFEALGELIAQVFDSEPVAAQPRYIADMGCGDGSLLRHVYEAVQSQTRRGQVLDRYPLQLIGADFNERALEATSRTLAGLPHLLVAGDIGDPEGLIRDLEARGITDPENILHIRSFLDHDRPAQSPQDDVAVARKRSLPLTGVYVGRDGEQIEPAIALQSLVEHLGRWRDAVSKYGLAMLEVHCLKPATVRTLRDRTGALHFDAYHAFSGQQLFEAPMFLMAAAEAGLFPDRASFRHFPPAAPFTRITLNRLVARRYRMRHPSEEDVKQLRALDIACWPENLAAPEAELRRRVIEFPLGQMVVEQDGRMIGALYSQRIDSVEQLLHTPYARFGSIHNPEGAVGHLLGLCVAPDMQGTGLADDILEFAFAYFSTCEGFEKLVGVSRCQNYARVGTVSLEQYIRQRDQAGRLIEPVLSFHEAHGAKIRQVVSRFRPEDTANEGSGVLIEYPNVRNAAVQAPEKLNAPVMPPAGIMVRRQVRETIEQVLGATRVGAYQDDAPWMAMGLTSLDLLDLRHRLNERFGREFDSAIFFQYGTPASITAHLDTQPELVQGMPATVQASPEPVSGLGRDPVKHFPTNKGADALVKRQVRELIEHVLGASRSGAYQDEAPWMAMGLTSLDLLDLRHRLNERFGLEFDSTIFFQYGTPASIIEHLAPQVSLENEDVFPDDESSGGPIANSTGSSEEGERRCAQGDQRIAIIGLSCRFPGAANTPEQFWELLKGEVDAVQGRPGSGIDRPRAPRDPLAERVGKSGGFLTDIDRFDASFFRVSPREAELMDPQQRFLLEAVWAALEEAGLSAAGMAGSDTGVFVGVMGHDYELLLRQQAGDHDRDPHFATGNAAAITAGRIAYYFDWHGPTLSVDTACSSSLVATHLACESLRAGECAVAVAGGVNLLLNAETFAAFGNAGMLSADGRCKTFDAGANGYVRGEGCGVLVLKRLADAERDGDPIWAIIRGSAINQDGASAGLTAPNQKAQQAVIEAALKRSGVAPHQVNYLEAHGTGTSLGDPIEVHAAAAALGIGRDESRPLLLGSVKTNIGHLETAAGVAGLIKVILSMRHGLIPRHLHFSTPNPHVAWDRLPVKVVAKAQPWPAGKMIAGVSSFGFSGTNAHVVLEGYDRRGSARAEVLAGQPVLVVLSARDEERLRAHVKQLQAYVQTHEVNLVDLAYTLQIGRDAMEHRLALTAGSIEDLANKLAQFLAGNRELKGSWQGAAKRDRGTLSVLALVAKELNEAVDKWVARGELETLGELWVQGLAVDWSALYGASRPSRVSLPTYPFAKERYWVPESGSTARTAQIAGALAVSGREAVLHPLVHRNTSDLSEQRYSTWLTGEEFVLRDHIVLGQRVVPGVAQLEWARAAVSLALGGAAAIRLEQVSWVRRLAVAEPLEVHIGLEVEDDGRISYEIYSGEGEEAQVYSQGWAVVSALGEAPTVDLAGLRAQCGRTLSSGDCYARFAAMGLHQGPSFQSLTQLQIGENLAVGSLQWPAPAPADDDPAYGLPPSLLDGALQACLLGLMPEDSGPTVPFAVQSVEQWSPVPVPAYAVVRPAAGDSAAVRKLQVEIVDPQGRVAVRLSGFSSRAVERLAPPQTVLLMPQWTARSLLAQAPEPDRGSAYAQHWVLWCEEVVGAGFDSSLEAALAPAQCVRLSRIDNGAGTDTLVQRYGAYARQVLAQLKRIVSAASAQPTLVQLVVPGRGEDAVLQGLGGMLRSAVQEYPMLTTQVVVTDTIADLAARLRAEAAQPVAVVRHGAAGRDVLEWVETSPADGSLSLPWRDGGVYWITGGMGGLGRVFAQAIAQQVREPVLVLTGRRALEPTQEAWLQDLRARGARAEYRSVAVDDEAAMAALSRSIVVEHGQLNGVIHTAGVLRDSLLANKTEADLGTVLQPKVAGVVALDEATRELALDWLVLCSSVASVWGNVGQVDYAAGNGFLDAYAAYRQGLVAQGLRRGQTISVSWPLWASGGMQVDAAGQERMRRLTGMGPLPDEAGIAAFAQGVSVASHISHVLVLHGDRKRLLTSVRAAYEKTSSTQTKAVPVQEQTVSVQAGSAGEARASVGTMPSGEAFAGQLERALTGLMATHLKMPRERLEREASLSEFGFDSITLTSFGNVLNQRYGLTLSPTVFFEAPTIAALTAYLVREHGDVLAPAFVTTSQVAKLERSTEDIEPITSLASVGRRLGRRPLAV